MSERLYLTGAAAQHIREGMARFELSPQEQRVAWYYIHGWSREEIAAELGITPNSVQGYLARIRAKCGYDAHHGCTAIRLLRRLLSPLVMRPMRRAA